MTTRTIWWQSSTNISAFPAYQHAIEQHAKKYLGSDCVLEVHGVPFGTTSIDYLAFGALNEHEILRNMLHVREANSYAAIALGCFHDPTLDASREILDIPVLGMAETAMAWARMYSRSPAVVFNNATAADKTIVHIVDSYDMRDRMVAPRFFELEVEQLVGAFERPEPAIAEFVKAARSAVDDGADMIIPGCGVLNLLMANSGVTRVPGTDVPIMDVTAALMTTCHAAVLMHEHNGFGVSRSAFYRSPPADLIDEVRLIYFPNVASAG